MSANHSSAIGDKPIDLLTNAERCDFGRGLNIFWRGFKILRALEGGASGKSGKSICQKKGQLTCGMSKIYLTIPADNPEPQNLKWCLRSRC